MNKEVFKHVNELRKNEIHLQNEYQKKLNDFETQQRKMYIDMIYCLLPILKEPEIIVPLKPIFHQSKFINCELQLMKKQKSIKLNEIGIHKSIKSMEFYHYPFHVQQLALLLGYLESYLSENKLTY